MHLLQSENALSGVVSHVIRYGTYPPLYVLWNVDLAGS